jgi:NADPH:quinone reductase-like Zn-dependent oxidoreductase
LTLHILKGDVPAVTDGRILGHEAVGTVDAVGSGVKITSTGTKHGCAGGTVWDLGDQFHIVEPHHAEPVVVLFPHEALGRRRDLTDLLQGVRPAHV